MNIINDYFGYREEAPKCVYGKEYDRPSSIVTSYIANTHRLMVDAVTFVNYSRNREIDTSRKEALYDYYIMDNVQNVPNIIHAWEHDGIVEIFDGIHRFSAAMERTRTPMNMRLDIYRTDDAELIWKEFVNINKSIPVPIAYYDVDTIKKQVCIDIPQRLAEEYEKFMSSSRSCHKPNFNRDAFSDFLFTLNIDFNKPNICSYIYDKLMDLNIEARNKVLIENIKTPQKCNKYNFYLFYVDYPRMREFIEYMCTQL